MPTAEAVRITEEPGVPLDLAHQLAILLRSKESELKTLSDIKAEFKARLEKLDSEIHRIREDILTGQDELFKSEAN